MRVLILAAGRGTRISRYLSGHPKCTVDIGEEILIKYTVRNFKKCGIDNIGIILGYNQEYIKEVLKDENVNFYYNPFYNVTNSIASAWFAKDFIVEDEDIIIMNGDVFLEEGLLKEIIEEELSPVLFCDDTRKEEADYKFYYENNKLIKYGKELEGDEITGEYIGVAKIKSDFIGKFKENLNVMINHQEHGQWWENALYTLSDKTDIFVKDINKKFWAEVDYIEDYERILNFRDYKIDYNISIKKV
ncbi:phosphocholine cytidylyltransferase family protein [Clostridium chauvoei]|uniref:Phosphocholine cytidylyltransferase family protein n=2 Tax=Clostridium chauvoei TaxID=46867 RepID=A0ABD4REP5_9CLOT|nr:phosphocholine cytidylyltransferase family protein [Clostridium chauvoei]ATD54289.1 choline-phosphate cytidylyltransferase [Clostridium chauvoei]ATD58028.1 choline-phosphate cytidylyltransferase [Clostridium chauvoei]MBX7279895.1 phosphocholine cytidylyltransferase family protein [Clostridium chauvoei]MBX7282187.1 phosphocholine cytidylyltransferase family protein [Clostridium chauvoei]MBX7284785.1 phosphocholine cytidylyltransferase family protein [Clostridium chauvoei]